MALERLQGLVHRFHLAAPNHFADWKNPTLLELNANPTNDPNGTIFNLTCALDTANTTFDLSDPEMDDSLSFCQESSDQEPMSDNVEVVFSAFRATGENKNAGMGAGWNTAHLAFTLLAWRGVEYFAILSVGEAPDAPFTAGDRIKMAYVVTDHGVDEIGTGENTRMTQTFGGRGRVNWNKTLTV